MSNRVHYNKKNKQNIGNYALKIKYRYKLLRNATVG